MCGQLPCGHEFGPAAEEGGSVPRDCHVIPVWAWLPGSPFPHFPQFWPLGLKAWQHSIHSMAQPALSSCGCGVLTLSNGGGLSSAFPLSQMWESISPVVGNSDYLKFLLFAGHPDVRGSVSLWPCASALSSHVCVVSPGSHARPCCWSRRDRRCLQAHGVGMATDSCSPV